MLRTQDEAREANERLADERVPVKGRCSECHSETDWLPCPVCVLAGINLEQTIADALLAHERRTGVRARLRAALADERVPQTYAGMPIRTDERVPPGKVIPVPERVPTPVTDEMVERAAAVIADVSGWTWEQAGTIVARPHEVARAALDAALNGGER